MKNKREGNQEKALGEIDRRNILFVSKKIQCIEDFYLDIFDEFVERIIIETGLHPRDIKIW